ncbi:hypothetical protein FACS1894130_11060 [Spirochaetia bacterium]|nr:hypothetical protein FACS1894130_11060 [Spirochaetia bacterium]
MMMIVLSHSCKNVKNRLQETKKNMIMQDNSVFNQPQYPYCQFADMGIDKIALDIDNCYLTHRDTPDFLK